MIHITIQDPRGGAPLDLGYYKFTDTSKAQKSAEKRYANLFRSVSGGTGAFNWTFTPVAGRYRDPRKQPETRDQAQRYFTPLPDIRQKPEQATLPEVA